MKKRVASIFTFGIILLTIFGCAEKSEIQAIESVELKTKYNFVLPIDSKVDVFAEDIDDLEPDVSDVYRRLAEALANTFIDREDGVSVPLTAKSYNFPGLEKINLDYVKHIALDEIKMSIPSDSKVNFDFVKKIKVYLLPQKEQMTVEQGGIQGMEDYLMPHAQEIAADEAKRVKFEQEYLSILKEKATTVMIFDKSFMVLGCKGKCFIFKNNNDLNWKKFLKTYSTFTIITETEVAAVPEDQFQFTGRIKFSIEINPEL